MGVYEILAISSPILGLSAFGCAQIVMVLLLRRRFMRLDPNAPLQKQLHLGLMIGLISCAVLWVTVFVICARAVLYETMAGNLIPLPLFLFVLACAFAGLITVSWFSMRHFSRDLEALTTEFDMITAEKRTTPDSSSPTPVLSSNDPELKKKARHAVLYLGAASYAAMVELLRQAGPSAS